MLLDFKSHEHLTVYCYQRIYTLSFIENGDDHRTQHHFVLINTFKILSDYSQLTLIAYLTHGVYHYFLLQLTLLSWMHTFLQL